MVPLLGLLCRLIKNGYGPDVRVFSDLNLLVMFLYYIISLIVNKMSWLGLGGSWSPMLIILEVAFT